MFNTNDLFKIINPVERFRIGRATKRVAVDRRPIQIKRSVAEFLWSVLIGVGGFLLFFSCGFWLFSDPNPAAGRVGGWIIGPVMGILFFVFAWNYFDYRLKGPK